MAAQGTFQGRCCRRRKAQPHLAPSTKTSSMRSPCGRTGARVCIFAATAGSSLSSAGAAFACSSFFWFSSRMRSSSACTSRGGQWFAATEGSLDVAMAVLKHPATRPEHSHAEYPFQIEMGTGRWQTPTQAPPRAAQISQA